MKFINGIKRKKISWKYVLFWILGILGAVVVGYFLFIGYGDTI